MTYIMSNDPCRCDHDFIEHDTKRTPKDGSLPKNLLPNRCTICTCDEYIPLPYTILQEARA